jgi:hypothetical protein
LTESAGDATALPPRRSAPRATADGSTRWADFGLLAITVMCSAAALHVTLSVSEPGALLVDDALYYVVPAKHLLAGRGYCFDGEARSSGVQPLWAAACIGLASLVHDRDALLRALSLAGASAWLAAGVVLYLGLRRVHAWLALPTATGWMLAGFSGHVAFQGMENGLHALLMASLLAVGCACLSARTAPHQPATGATSGGAERASGTWVLLGVLLALFTLARVDSGLAALLVGATVLFGLVRVDGPARLGFRWRSALRLALPGVLIVGGWLGLSQVYFGTLMPISGKVKFFHNPPPRTLAGMDQLALSNAVRVFDLAARPAVEGLEAAAGRWLGVWPKHELMRAAVGALLALGSLVTIAAGLRGLLARRGVAWFFAALVLFVGLRLVIYSVRLPSFTAYCTWYFSPEIMACWLLLGIGAWSVGRAPDWLLSRLGLLPPGAAPFAIVISCLATIILAISNAPLILRPPADPAHVNPFVRAGRWLESRLPPGQNVASFSAGFVSYYAPSQRVINVDGLMNDPDFFENYLKLGRLPQYLELRGAVYLSDYVALDVLRDRRRNIHGLRLHELEVLRGWCMDEQNWYCVWRIPPLDPDAPPTPPAVAPDLVSQAQLAALVRGEYAVVAEDELATALNDEPPDGRSTLCSFAVPPALRLRHVLATDEQRRRLDWRPGRVDIAQPVSVRFGEALELLGVEVPRRRVARGGRLIMTRFWRRLADAPPHLDASIELWLHPADPLRLDSTSPAQRVLHATRGCHDTYKVARWRTGEVVVETIALDVLPQAPPGVYPLMLGVYDPQLGWVMPDRGAGPGRPLCYLGNVEIE